MQRVNSSGIGANPGDGIGAGVQARAYVQLQHDGRLRVFGNDLHRARAVNCFPLRLVVVISRLQSGRFEHGGGGIQHVGDRFPAV